MKEKATIKGSRNGRKRLKKYIKRRRQILEIQASGSESVLQDFTITSVITT